MLRSVWSSALRNLRRHPLMSVLGIVALSLGMSGALLGGLLLRSELTYEHYIPGYEHLYLAASGMTQSDRPAFYLPESPAFLAGLMRRQFPEIEQTARAVRADVRLRHGATEARERLYWTDPAFFDLFHLNVIQGSLPTALQRADGIVIPRAIAEKYFPGTNAIGQVLLLDGKHPALVQAVIEDLPAHGTLLESGIFASGSAAYSGLSECERRDEENARQASVGLCGLTFLRLRPGTHAQLLRRGEADLVRSFPVSFPGMLSPVFALDEVHLFKGFNPGGRDRLYETLAISLLVLLAAVVVYVNLATARSGRRGIEVGIRKACGASYGLLMTQFLLEALLTTAVAALLAISLTELILPRLNGWLDLHLQFEYWRDFSLIPAMLAAVLLIGSLAGAYPAMVLSALRPTQVLKGTPASFGGVSARQVLVVTQCAILIGLVVASSVILRQRDFAVHEAITLQSDQVLVIHARCLEAFIDGLRKLHGISAVQCSQASLLTEESFDHVTTKQGMPLTVNWIETDLTALRFYGVATLAGQAEALPGDSQVVINEALRRALHFVNAGAAIGQPLELKERDGGDWVGNPAATDGEAASSKPAVRIVAVVPDFTLEAALHPVRPTLYWPLRPPSDAANPTDPEVADQNAFVHVRLKGAEMAQTLPRIDSLWHDILGSTRDPDARVERFFLKDYIESRYRSVLNQGQILAGFSALAVLLAGMGLLGLAAAATERRTREIGIRKALGADRIQILLMLVAQFARPVLWASLMAWPVSGWIMHRWLQSFALHVPLGPGYFVAASGLALAVAIATVAAHAWRTASAPPVAALRYE